MVNQERPPTPIQILHQEGISAEEIPKGDMEKAWFLYHHADTQAGEHFFITSLLHISTISLFTLAFMLLAPRGQYIILGIGLITGFLQILKAYKDECLKIRTETDYLNWMEQIIRKNEQLY